MGTVGAGSPGHLLGLLLQKETGTRFGLVAYRGAGPAIQDVVAGQIDTTFVNTATSLPQVRAGSIKAFAVTAKNRLAVAPDIQSVNEAGLPGLHFSLWAGLFAPKGTPKNIIDKLNSAAVDTLSDPKGVDRLEERTWRSGRPPSLVIFFVFFRATIPDPRNHLQTEPIHSGAKVHYFASWLIVVT